MVAPPCKRCGKCCLAPKVKLSYSPDNERFYLYHGLVGERVGEYIEFEIGRDCDHLTKGGCDIYDERPQICKDYTCQKGTTVELSVLDRMILMNVLPSRGRIEQMRVLHEFKMGIAFDEDEIKSLAFHDTEDHGTEWDLDAAQAIGLKDVEVGDAVKATVIDTFEKLEEKDEFHESWLPLWDKFKT